LGFEQSEEMGSIFLILLIGFPLKPGGQQQGPRWRAAAIIPRYRRPVFII